MPPPNTDAGQVSVASAQGERDHQEDCAIHQWIECPSVTDGTGWLLAVFDGHGGRATVDHAFHVLPSLFKTHLMARQGDVPRTLRDVFSALNHLTRNQVAGSTASMAYIPQNAQHICLGVLGDSPIALSDSQDKIHIGPDHNVRTNPKERAAAQSRGGIYIGGYLEDPQRPGVGLQMTRSLGDVKLARVLNREPEIETIALGGRGIVLVGTDGLLLPGGEPNADQLARILRLIREGADADGVIQDALARKTGDNVTAIIWRQN